MTTVTHARTIRVKLLDRGDHFARIERADGSTVSFTDPGEARSFLLTLGLSSEEIERYHSGQLLNKTHY